MPPGDVPRRPALLVSAYGLSVLLAWISIGCPVWDEAIPLGSCASLGSQVGSQTPHPPTDRHGH